MRVVSKNFPIVGLIALCPGIVIACSAVEVDPEAQSNLFNDLRNAQTEMAERAINDEIWRIFVTAPDTKSQAILDEGRKRIRYGDYQSAEAILSELIVYCPHHTGGWNQRAFVRFLRHDYGRALGDIEQALELEPKNLAL